jgi:hypothetical protein
MSKHKSQNIKKVFFTHNVEVLTNLVNKLTNNDYVITLEDNTLTVMEKVSTKICYIPVHNIASYELE